MIYIFLLLFFPFFVKTISNKSPIVLTPGLYGSNLYINYTKGTKVPWYCPSSMNDELIWLTPMQVLPLGVNCVHHLCQATYDPETQQFHNLPGVNISVHDFGGKESVDYVIKSSNGKFHFYDGFNSLLNYYFERGYKLKENFFVAPYDWRLGPQFIDDFWDQYRKLIEEAYEKSNGQKVTLLGFSMGCFIIQQFLTADQSFSEKPLFRSIRKANLIVNTTWKSKYIEKVVLIAPSFGGTLTYYESMIQRVSLLFPYVRNEHISDMSTSLPGFHSHHPNYVIFKDYQLVKGPDGRNYTIEELDEVILKNSNIKRKFLPGMNVSLDVQREAPRDIGAEIPLAIIYNSGVKTLSFMHFKKNWYDYPKKYYEGKGDGTITADVPVFICKKWSAEKRPIVCVDVEKSDKSTFKHSALPTNPFVLDILYNLTSPEGGEDEEAWWRKKGRFEFHLGDVHTKSELDEMHLEI